MHSDPLQCVARVLVVTLLFVVPAALAFGNDQQKAEKRLRQISALAVDVIPRAIVNQTMSDAVHAKRIELMRQRHAMNLSYGQLLLAHQLTDAGAKMLDIAVEMEDGKTIFQVANERNVNWKAVAEAAKHLNEKVEENIYRYFLHGKAEDLVSADKYDAHTDVVRADADLTSEEIADARSDYNVWKARGSGPRASGQDARDNNLAHHTSEVYKGESRPHPGP